MNIKRIAAAIIEDRDHHIYLQLRDNKPAINHPNHWGLFGGTVEDGEDPSVAIVRELNEELLLVVRRERLHFLGNYAETPTKMIYAFHYSVLDDMQTAILQEGQRIGRFNRSILTKLDTAMIEGHPLIPSMWQILQTYMHFDDNKKKLHLVAVSRSPT